MRAGLLMEGCGGKLCQIKLQFLKLLTRQMCRHNLEGLCPEAVVVLSTNRTQIIDKFFPKIPLNIKPEFTNRNECNDDETIKDKIVGKLVDQFMERFKTEITFEEI